MWSATDGHPEQRFADDKHVACQTTRPSGPHKTTQNTGARH